VARWKILNVTVKNFLTVVVLLNEKYREMNETAKHIPVLFKFIIENKNIII
jgi:hypothetical protein